MKVLIFTRYGFLGASSRVRTLAYQPFFESADIHCEISSLISDEMLRGRYKYSRYRFFDILSSYGRRIYKLLFDRDYDVIVIEKELFPWLPGVFELLLLKGRKYIIDYDDAVYVRYEDHRLPVVRLLMSDKIKDLMRGSFLVISGNPYISDYASKMAMARKVEIVPTAIDIKRYTNLIYSKNNNVPIIVWIGSPSTVLYLQEIYLALEILSRKVQFKLRVIGAKGVHIHGVNIEYVPWTYFNEVESISECDIGIMPLKNSRFEQGKCGYKLIQYMGCGLPVVASPIGVNSDIVMSGQNGFLANSLTDWVESLQRLLTDSKLRAQMGKAGREIVENKYTTQVNAYKIINLLKSVKSQ